MLIRTRGFRWGAALASIALAWGASNAGAASDWTLIDLGTLGGPGSYGSAVSNNGTVVGCSDVPGGGTHAFIYRNGVMQDLGTASDSPGNSCALAVNNNGTVAGRSSSGELVVWNEGSLTRLGVKGNIGAMNDAGVIVGAYLDGTANRAFMLKDGVITSLGTLGAANDARASSAANAINSRNQVVGTSNGRAFLYDSGTMRDLGTLGGVSAAARGINSRGEIVGMSTDPYSAPTAFIFQGAMQALPGPSYSSGTAINDRGQVVGSAEGYYGYVIENGGVSRLDRLAAVVSRGWRHLEPTGINDRGWIVGTATNAEGDLRAFLLTPVNAQSAQSANLLERKSRGSTQ